MTTPSTISFEPLHLAHADASDPQKYRAAKAQAAAAGVSLVIDPVIVAPPPAPPANAIIVPDGVDSATYRRLKAEAEAADRPLVFASQFTPAA